MVARQLRSSAGTFIKCNGKSIILDPEPGTLVRCAKAKPKIDVTKIDAIVLIHSHIDHSNDVNVVIDAMTDGGLKKRGILFAPKDCLDGENAVVPKYLDTKYFPELIESYRGSDILIIKVVRRTPHENSRVMHLCIDDLKRILSMIKPRKAILTHFGMTMLRAQPWVLAKKLTEELDVEVIVASDGMKIEIP